MTVQRSLIVALAVVLWAGQAYAQAGRPAAPATPAPAPAAPAAPAPATPAPAAAAPAAPAAATSDPAQTTATYGDWVLRCVRPENSPRVCEVVQSMVVQGQQQPVAQVAVGYDKADLRFTMLVPPAISLSRAPFLGIPGATQPHYDLTWRRCLPNGCFADVQVGAEMQKLLRSRNDPMQIEFKDAGERDVKLPLSLRGLVAALDALAKEPR
jgi:invasion protein IalB